MEKVYYLSDIDGGFLVDQYYMDNYFDPDTDTVIMCGTKEEVEEHIEWLCNN